MMFNSRLFAVIISDFVTVVKYTRQPEWTQVVSLELSTKQHQDSVWFFVIVVL